MVKFVGFNRTKFSEKFVIDKIVSLVLISVVKNNWVAKVHSVRVHIRYREDSFNLASDIMRNVLVEKDGRLLEIGTLT